MGLLAKVLGSILLLTTVALGQGVVDLSMLKAGAATNGQCIVFNSSTSIWEPGACSGGTTDHSALSNLDYASSGHTGFQPTITAGTTAQYYRGDKSWQPFAHDHSGDSLLPTNVTLTNLYFGGTTSSDVLLKETVAGGQLQFRLGDDSAYAPLYSGDLTVYDDTPTTGKTAFSIRGGAGNSTAGSTPVLTYFDNDGITKRFWVQENGVVFNLNAGFAATSNGVIVKGYLGGNSGVTPGLGLSSDSAVYWRDSTSWTTGSPDTGLKRQAAGKVAATDGSTGIGTFYGSFETPSGSTTDDTSATSTAPFKAGLNASRPATCTTDQFWFETDATSGQQLFACTATNTWTLQGDGSPGAVLTTRTLTGGSGVATIGDLSADRTVDLDFGSESEDVAPAGADFVLVEDATVGGQFRKVQITNLPTSGTGDVVGPSSSVAGEAVAFDGTTGKLIKVATGCSWSVSAGSKGYLNCDGGFSAGDGTYAGAWVTEETTANGGTYQFALFGPDAQAADRCIVYPDAQPADNQILKATASTASVAQDGKTWTGCRVMAWEADVGSGGPVTDDTVLVGNGTAGVEATLPACANATTSKLLYDQATNAFSCGTDQTGAGSAVDCTDPANSCLWDEFMAGEVGTNNISALGWRKTASTYVYQPGEDGAPGIFQVGSTTVLDDVASLALAAGSTVEPLLAMDTKTFTLQMRFRTGRTTDIGAHVGIKDDVSFGVNGDGFFLSFDTAAAETTYQYVVCDGTCYTADSGAALSTLWRRVKITNDGGSVATFSLYDETGALIAGSTKTFCTAASGCDVNSVVFPTGATMQHVFVVVNRGSTTVATIDAEYFSFQMTGLTR